MRASDTKQDQLHCEAATTKRLLLIKLIILHLFNMESVLNFSLNTVTSPLALCLREKNIFVFVAKRSGVCSGFNV